MCKIHLISLFLFVGCLQATAYGSIANLHNMRDEAHLAIAYYQKALPIFEKYQWLESTSILYHNMGELYETMGNYAEARRNFTLALAMGHKAQ